MEEVIRDHFAATGTPVPTAMPVVLAGIFSAGLSVVNGASSAQTESDSLGDSVDALRLVLRDARDRAHWLAIERRQPLASYIEALADQAWRMANHLSGEMSRERSAAAELERLRAALLEIAERPTVERNPDGADQASLSMRFIARDALGMFP